MKTSGLLTAACLCLHFVCFCARQSTQPITEQSLQRYRCAREYYSRDRLTEALDLLLQNHRIAPHFSANSFLIGKIYLFQGEYAQAEQYWNDTLRQNPHHLDTRKWLARMYLQQQRVSEAGTVLEEALRLSSEDPELLILMAKVKREQDDLAAAIELYQRAQAFCERLCEASLDLAEIYFAFGLIERAEDQLNRAAALLGADSSLTVSIQSALNYLEQSITPEEAP